MAKTKISEFSTTAGNNTDINSINIAEGCAPSGINDAIRELMRQLKEFQTGGAGDSVNSGGDFSVATNKFTVASASGNTAVAGTLAVTGTTTLTGALVANGNATLGDGSGDTVTVKGTPTLEVNPTLSGGTANGVLYLNGSKVATSGSALTFDGTSLGIGGSPTFYQGSGLLITRSGFATIRLNDSSAGGTAAEIKQSDSTGLILESISNRPIQFNVNATEAMRLTSTGLGIGTSSPSQKLTVSGNAAISGQITASSFYSNTTGYILGQGSEGVVFANATDVTLRTPASGNINFQQGSTTVGKFDSSGNLLVGATSNPGILNKSVVVDSGASNLVGFVMQNDTTGRTSSDGGAMLMVGAEMRLTNYENNAMLFSTNNTERARIDSSGNFIHQVNGTAPSLSTNSTMSFELTSNTSLKIVVRGTDGTTRSATLVLV